MALKVRHQPRPPIRKSGTRIGSPTVPERILFASQGAMLIAEDLSLLAMRCGGWRTILDAIE
jgi:hypothetical protein